MSTGLSCNFIMTFHAFTGICMRGQNLTPVYYAEVVNPFKKTLTCAIHFLLKILGSESDLMYIMDSGIRFQIRSVQIRPAPKILCYDPTGLQLTRNKAIFLDFLGG